MRRIKNIHLNQGQLFFAGSGVRIHTLLGSCVAITAWHKERRIGAMCHYALPRAPQLSSDEIILDPRYAEDCMEIFKHKAASLNTRLKDYEFKVFGGGLVRDQVAVDAAKSTSHYNIGAQNAEAAMHLLHREKLYVKSSHLGQSGYRRLIFNVDTGDVWVKYSEFA